MKITNTEDCEHCSEKEDLLHLYWNCPRSKRLWERLKILIEQNQRTPFTINKSTCLLGEGIWPSKRTKEVCQTLCILTKHFIHLCKCDKKVEGRIGMRLDSYIKHTLKLEHRIAQENGYQNSFTAKWGQWIQWMET